MIEEDAHFLARQPRQPADAAGANAANANVPRLADPRRQVLEGAHGQAGRAEPAAVVVGCAQRRTEEPLSDESRLAFGIGRVAGQPGAQGDAAARPQPAGGAAEEGRLVEKMLATFYIPHHIERGRR